MRDPQAMAASGIRGWQRWLRAAGLVLCSMAARAAPAWTELSAQQQQLLQPLQSQ